MHVKYKFLGSNDDKDFCSCCGKHGLKRVVWLEHIESSEINHYGVNCAAKLLNPLNKKGYKIDTEGLNILAALRDQVSEKYWNLQNHREFVLAIGKELFEMGLEDRFGYLSGKTDVFCNFIWPYKRHIGMQ